VFATGEGEEVSRREPLDPLMPPSTSGSAVGRKRFQTKTGAFDGATTGLGVAETTAGAGVIAKGAGVSASAVSDAPTMAGRAWTVLKHVKTAMHKGSFMVL